MSNPDTSAKKYLSCVKHELKLYSFAFKKKALHTLANDLLSFQEDMPEANFEQICKQFGHPNKFADGLLESLDSDELKMSAHKKRTTIWMVILSLILLLVIGGIRLIFIRNHTVAHTVETTIVYVEESRQERTSV